MPVFHIAAKKKKRKEKENQRFIHKLLNALELNHIVVGIASIHRGNGPFKGVSRLHRLQIFSFHTHRIPHNRTPQNFLSPLPFLFLDSYLMV